MSRDWKSKKINWPWLDLLHLLIILALYFIVNCNRLLINPWLVWLGKQFHPYCYRCLFIFGSFFDFASSTVAGSYHFDKTNKLCPHFLNTCSMMMKAHLVHVIPLTSIQTNTLLLILEYFFLLIYKFWIYFNTGHTILIRERLFRRVRAPTLLISTIHLCGFHIFCDEDHINMWC